MIWATDLHDVADHRVGKLCDVGRTGPPHRREEAQASSSAMREAIGSSLTTTQICIRSNTRDLVCGESQAQAFGVTPRWYRQRMPRLDPKERAGLPDRAFAYIDSTGSDGCRSTTPPTFATLWSVSARSRSKTSRPASVRGCGC